MTGMALLAGDDDEDSSSRAYPQDMPPLSG
jgi:hypothetical protein